MFPDNDTSTGSVNDAVNKEVNDRVETVAAAAAQQVDEANKNAEAIARAAIQTNHGARMDELEGKFNTWQSDQTAKYMTLEAKLSEGQVRMEQSLSSIQSKLTAPAQEPSLTVIQPETEKDAKGAPAEPAPSSKPQDTTKEKTPSPARRERRLL